MSCMRDIAERTVHVVAAGRSGRGTCHAAVRHAPVMEMVIALFGPPGSGKGTQAARLRDELGFVTLSTGELLRQARAEGSELGRRASAYMDRGDLVPDELIGAVIDEEIGRRAGSPIVLDGFPRTVAQA